MTKKRKPQLSSAVELEAVRFARRNGLILALSATCPLCAIEDPVMEFRHPIQKNLVMYGHMKGGPCPAQGIWRLLKLPEFVLDETEDNLREADFLPLPRRTISPPPGRPDWDEIAGMFDEAIGESTGKAEEGYETGVRDALGWVIGKYAEPPL